MLPQPKTAIRGAVGLRQTQDHRLAAPCCSRRLERLHRNHSVRRARTDTQTEVETAVAETEVSTEAASRCPVLQNLRPLQPPVLSRWESLMLTTFSSTNVVNRALSKEKIAGNWFLGTPSVIIGDPTALKEVAELEQQDVITTGYPPSTVMLLGKNSITMETNLKKHKFLRRMLMPVTSQEAIENYLPDIKQLAEETLASWAERCEKTNEVVLSAPDLKTFTFNVITKVVLGMELTPQQRTEFENEFRVWLKHLFSALPINQWPFPFREGMVAREKMINRIMGEIRKERAAIAADKAKGVLSAQRNKKILRRLLIEKDDNGRGLSDEEAADNMLNLLFAGHDTTFAHLTRVMYDLQAHPQVLAKLREEQKDILARFGPALTPKAVRAMTYANAVSQESMRLTPPIGGVLRNSRQDFGLKGIAIPGKQVISISTSYMAKNDSRWPQGTGTALDGDVFNPDRFLTPEGQEQGGQYPFGFGNHMCLGINLVWAETRVFLAVLARGYKYKADLNTQWSNFPILHPTNGLPLWVEKL